MVSKDPARWILGKTGDSVYILEEEDLNKCNKKEKTEGTKKKGRFRRGFCEKNETDDSRVFKKTSWGEEKEREIKFLTDFWGKHKGPGKERLQLRLSRYASCYSQNSYLYSISPFGRFGVFNILLIGVDGKGHKLFCWNWFFIYLLCSSFC